MRRIISLLLLLALLAGGTSLAEGAARNAYPANWYEIFVRSYADSDGDGIGDLGGVIGKLDYIEDMGWRGIWLMPIMPSPSYHKYDVTDYCGVDPEYGTLDDMRALADECRARGIRLIVDLPINHTSTQHPWFQEACDALRAGDEACERVGWYNFTREDGQNRVPVGDTGWYYEEQFAGGGMPDLNLANPQVREEVRQIMDFWLNDIGVDGFRLDAVTSYFTGDAARNIELLAGLKTDAEALKPGSLLIGECWANLKTIAEYYASGVDSFFLFPASQAEGFIASSVNAARRPAEKYAAGYRKALEAIGDGWLTPFLCNHDTGRTVGLVRGRTDLAAAKFAEGVLGTLTGGAFTYYGEEIGMVGSGDDPNKRLAMDWGDGSMTQQPPGTTSVEYAWPGVAAQAEDPDSLLNYVRAVNHMRLAFPQISGGENEFLLAEDALCLMRRADAAGSCLIAMNFDKKRTLELEVADAQIAYELETGDARAEWTGESALSLPPRSIVILLEGAGEEEA